MEAESRGVKEKHQAALCEQLRLWPSTLSEHCLPAVLVLFSGAINNIKLVFYTRPSYVQANLAAQQFVLQFFTRCTIKNNFFFLKKKHTEPDLSKDHCSGLSGAMKHPSLYFCARTIAPGEIGSPLAVRDDCVFRGSTIDDLKWLSQMFLLSLLQVRGHSSATSATPPSKGRTRSTSTSRWCTTATRSTSATCARRPLSPRRSSRATRRWMKKRAGARQTQSQAVIACLQGLLLLSFFFFLPEMEFKLHFFKMFFIWTARTLLIKTLRIPRTFIMAVKNQTFRHQSSVITPDSKGKKWQHFHCFTYSLSLMKVMQLTPPTSPTVKPGGDVHVDRAAYEGLGNQFLCWLGMAVSPLALRGFKALNRSGCRLWALNLTASGVVMDQDWNQTDSWHEAKENVLEVVSEQ